MGYEVCAVKLPRSRYFKTFRQLSGSFCVALFPGMTALLSSNIIGTAAVSEDAGDER